MKTLNKTTNEIFNEYYTGETSGLNKKTFKYEEKKVICILDDNCVRYSVVVNGKCVKRKEFENHQKKLCFNSATDILNK